MADASRTQVEIDVAVLAPPEAGRPRRILSLGGVKWGEVMTPGHLACLTRARELRSPHYETADCGSPATRRLASPGT
ncbi:MAG TPA: hypothetical protein VFQ44_29730 [Streptosporangiaceae bacterium]|nr:hypothetical protein [Streptosporangiaceae bacterium]